MFNVALFGTGRIGQLHIINLVKNKHINLSCICDPFNENINSLAKAYQTEIKTEDEIFADPTIDVVFIASITSTHSELLKKAIETKKHIFCEKPIDLNIQNILEVQELASQTNIKIGIGFNRRFDKTFTKLQQHIKSGKAGKLEILSIISKDPSPPPVSYIKSSGGLIRDMMIHDLDMLYYLIGDDEVKEVYANGSNLVSDEIKQANDIDSASVLLKTKNGSLITITNSRRCSSGYDQRIEAHCEKAFLCASNVPENYLTVADKNNTVSALPVNFFLERYMDAYAQEITEFVDWLQNKCEFKSSLSSGVKSAKLAESVILSINEHKAIYL